MNFKIAYWYIHWCSFHSLPVPMDTSVTTGTVIVVGIVVLDCCCVPTCLWLCRESTIHYIY